MNAKKIIVVMEDETQKEIDKGFVTQFNNDVMHVDTVNVSKSDIVRIAYGMMVTVEKMGMSDLLVAYANGSILPDEEDY